MNNLSDEDIKKKNKKKIFIRDGMPGEWLSYAEELMDAAELLWENRAMGIQAELLGTQNKADSDKLIIDDSRIVSTISKPYFLLVGFAIENLFKGLLVYQNPSNITSGKISKNLKSHKLLTLAQKIPEISLSQEEREICYKIEKAIPYWGRYPIPLEYNGVMPFVGVTLEIKNTIKNLFNRISLTLYNKIKNGWDSGKEVKSLKYLSKRYDNDSD